MNKLPPEDGGAGAPNPEPEVGGPKELEVITPNPDDGIPALGVAGDAG